ncbi:hypothetical protein ACNOYE_34785 [Nannocystaceae bacterium ST9]
MTEKNTNERRQEKGEGRDRRADLLLDNQAKEKARHDLLEGRQGQVEARLDQLEQRVTVIEQLLAPTTTKP